MSKGSKHTPGPWSVGESEKYIDIKAGSPRTVARVPKLENYKGDMEANARLIAAAPECLSALQAIRHLIEMSEVDDTLLDQIYSATEDAVAKATGGAE